MDREGAGARRRRMAEPRAALSGALVIRERCAGRRADFGGSGAVHPGSPWQTPGFESSRNRAIRASALPARRITRATVPLPGMRGTGGMAMPRRMAACGKSMACGRSLSSSRGRTGPLDARRLTRPVCQWFAMRSTRHRADRSRSFAMHCLETVFHGDPGRTRTLNLLIRSSGGSRTVRRPKRLRREPGRLPAFCQSVMHGGRDARPARLKASSGRNSTRHPRFPNLLGSRHQGLAERLQSSPRLARTLAFAAGAL